MAISQKTKSGMLPVAIAAGILCGWLLPGGVQKVSLLIPYLVAGMLLVAYSKLSFKHIKISKMHLLLFVVQTAGSLILWKLISLWNPQLGQEAFICLFCPIAISAPVVVGMLGGSLSSVVTYILFSYLAMTVTAPLLLPLVSAGAVAGTSASAAAGTAAAINGSFLISSLSIAKKVMPLILIPLLLAALLKWKARKTVVFLQNNQSIAFYLWAFTLALVIGKSTTYVIAEPKSMIPQELGLAAVSLVCCLLQFGAGRLIGIRCKNPVAATQSLGQKNVAFSMWLIFSYMDPMLSVGMAAYSIFQNIVNSLQIYLHSCKEKQYPQ